MQTRRDFLKLSAVGTMSLTWLNCSSSKATRPKIAILGGGIAGLSAAHYLKKNGVIAQVYEAQSRVGGRILTGKSLVAKDVTTEIGGEFIDSSHTDILNFCKEFDLSLLDMQSPSESNLVKTDFFFENKRRPNFEILEELKLHKPFLNDITLIQTDDKKRYVELDKLSIDEYLHSVQVSGWLANLFKTSFTSELGLESDVQSCITMLSMLSVDLKTNKFEIYGDSDERYKVVGGNERIIDELVKRLENQINTDYVIEKISQKGKGYTISFQNGQEIISDIIILTLPFSALRNIKLEIEMPEMKRKCINELDYGTQSKLFFGFKERFWRENNFSGYVLNDKLHNGWDSSQMQKNNQGEGSYTLFMGGKKGLELGKNQYEYYLNELEKIYSGAKENYIVHNSFNWSQNPYVKGAYSCYKVGQMSTIAGWEGKAVGNIFFAGEHCSKEYGGYMNGAVETANKVARTILQMTK